MLDYNDLLWIFTPWEEQKLAITRALVPGVLVLVSSTYGHSGVARTFTLVKYRRPTVAQDVRDYVFSCGCRGRKQA